MKPLSALTSVLHNEYNKKINHYVVKEIKFLL